ncbi:ABC transporter substrate-binding protein [Chelatococcus asaccharovorans]|uniref:Amino acid/amide ABC transporter substrate-binding protein (HAAT family) n=1 Tax=Chelatococcus asaccharovorans TaxID=28210 RepID=A0A2V3UGF5_9HYPH|nr:amino acid/amide ABC transporter substrate-binding protein (HAAT family) [Chelatococcus asaccharovorans]
MKAMRILALGVAVVCAATPALPPAARAQETVRIGLTGPFTGGSAPLGVSIRDGVRLAADAINARGGLGGRKLELIERDDESKPERGIQIAQELTTKEGVIGVVGIANTPVALAASRLYQEAKTPIIIPVATGSQVSQQFTPPAYAENYIFRIGAFDTIQSAMMAEEMVQRRKITKLAILADSTNYGQLGKDDLVAALAKLGVTPVLVEKFNVRDVDMTPQLLKARAAGAQGVFGYALGPDLAQIANSMAKIGWKVPYITSWNASMSNYIDNAGVNGEGVYMPQTFIQDAGVSPRWAAFITAYQKAFGVERLPNPSSAAQSYDAMLLLAAAVAQAGPNPNGAQVKAALEDLKAPVEGVIATYERPFSAEDHEATVPEHVVFGTVKAGRVVFADEVDRARVGK